MSRDTILKLIEANQSPAWLRVATS